MIEIHWEQWREIMANKDFQFATVDEAAEEFRQGRPIVLVDD
jgi:hypothetical protein